MQTYDYNALLDERSFAEREKSFVRRALPVGEVYRNSNGVQYLGGDADSRYQYEIVRLSEGAYLLATDCPRNADARARQVVTQGDWVHIQFRIKGDGQEVFPDVGMIETPAQSCLVARYPEHCLIERSVSDQTRRRFVCLFMQPRAVKSLLDASTADFPRDISWIGIEEPLELQVHRLPIQPSMSLLVNDIISCSYSGNARRAFMRAKSIELLSTVIHELNGATSAERNCGERLSPSDMAKIALVRSIISEQPDGTWTLADLAARVGLNRAKLASGFRSVYGVPVRTFWRDVSLERARSLLRHGKTSVTEVALDMGYSDTNSFTRAFRRKFGVLPREWKKSS